MKKTWIVTIECVVDKEVVCENCTEDQARDNPWDYAIDEREVSQSDWTVKSVKENK